MSKTESLLKQAQAPLGEKSAYVDQYDPAQLCPIPRQQIWTGSCYRTDVWTGYEISWLNEKGKPVAAMATFDIPGDSPSIIESKSFKLYLNSFNGYRVASWDRVAEMMARDLSAAAGAQVSVTLQPLHQLLVPSLPEGLCLDDLDVTIDHYLPEASLLSHAKGAGSVVEEVVHSNLLKSNCPVTGQPDWGTVVVRYVGKAIDHESLLRYIVSYRNHGDFHEQCVEQIFTDIMMRCQPEQLTVYARYVRRGGLDINPWRSTSQALPTFYRLPRQ
ncbi:hypothetical protein WH50_02505 [Pokkaliibacter plantistimulans]|uniref:NADPH-dependent 7-cyano-7-deazaguanine reductase n=1 Tax=Pokkaliibacter plantistimulans TaxID=1635171 RepID=A0ABX5M5G8_9GAMM|nr:NADPH-dependent 7-cyano-7-deazaguanine reductase QueF [Pokkaliibacter plantistimulans]PXF32833.1 hypothetical protein WH50_02505 [Pokkaliibacter plantistimulans]